MSKEYLTPHGDGTTVSVASVSRFKLPPVLLSIERNGLVIEIALALLSVLAVTVFAQKILSLSSLGLLPQFASWLTIVLSVLLGLAIIFLFAHSAYQQQQRERTRTIEKLLSAESAFLQEIEIDSRTLLRGDTYEHGT